MTRACDKPQDSSLHSNDNKNQISKKIIGKKKRNSPAHKKPKSHAFLSSVKKKP